MSRDRCAILFPKRGISPEDTEGCTLPRGHFGPHSFVTSGFRVINWEVDFDCDCESCESDEPDDWCIVYWEESEASDATN